MLHILSSQTSNKVILVKENFYKAIQIKKVDDESN